MPPNKGMRKRKKEKKTKREKQMTLLQKWSNRQEIVSKKIGETKPFQRASVICMGVPFIPSVPRDGAAASGRIRSAGGDGARARARAGA